MKESSLETGGSTEGQSKNKQQNLLWILSIHKESLLFYTVGVREGEKKKQTLEVCHPEDNQKGESWQGKTIFSPIPFLILKIPKTYFFSST